MVVENLLLSQLLPQAAKWSGRWAAPLQSEMTATRTHPPADIYAAVDMNHIAHPEQLIDASRHPHKRACT